MYFQEEYSDGGIVVEDCLKLMLNLLRNNSSNQTFFREGSYIQRISLFFDLNLDQEELEVGWAAQKVSNMLYMLSVVRTLVSPSNPTQVLKSNFKLLLSKREVSTASRAFFYTFSPLFLIHWSVNVHPILKVPLERLIVVWKSLKMSHFNFVIFFSILNKSQKIRQEFTVKLSRIFRRCILFFKCCQIF